MSPGTPRKRSIPQQNDVGTDAIRPCRPGKLPPMTALRHSPLHERHKALGAKFSRFGGWEMPLEYAGGGVLKEHASVRDAVGVFDVTHLGKVTVRGPGAAEFLNRCLTNDIDKIGAGQAQYTM